MSCAKSRDDRMSDSGTNDDAGAAPDAALPDAGPASDAAVGPPFFPCTEAIPTSSGLERCDPHGYLRRVGPATCTPRAPRTSFLQSAYPDLDECSLDSECEHLSLGRCEKREGGNTLVCVAGCETDADCEEGRVCLCGDSVGRCVPAACDNAAACAPGYECRLAETVSGCPSMRFECQTPEDTCAMSCFGFSPNPAFCVWDGRGFGCSITQCTQP
jgi:hypothetical protein